MSDAPRARKSGMDPVRELHTGQRRVNSRINQAGHTEAPEPARPTPSENLLHLKGRPHTDIHTLPGKGRPEERVGQALEPEAGVGHGPALKAFSLTNIS